MHYPGKYCVLGFIVLAASATTTAAANLDGFAYAQLTAEEVENNEDASKLGFDRVRIGLKGELEQLFGFLQLDFNAPNSKDAPTGTPPNWIRDAYLGYDFGPARLLGGQFKAPVGMDFNVSGKKLDITKRGLERPLVLERTSGLMLSGRNLGEGFGYDLALLNPAGRSGAVFGADDDPFDQVGEDVAYAVRGHYDPNEQFHLEASYGVSQDAGGADASEDYSVFDLGAAAYFGKLNLKAEYIDGSDVLGVSGRDQQVYYLQTGFRFAKKLEAVARHYAGDSEVGGVETDLTNTYLGVNLFLGPNETNGRLQINYVLAGGDETRWNGLGGFTDDALLVQLQLSVVEPLLQYF